MTSPVLKKNKLKEKLHHAWSIFLLSLAIVIVFAAVALTLVRESTPLLAYHHQNIQTWLAGQLKHSIKIGSVSAGWHGFEPIINIHDVTIEDAKHQPLVHVNFFSVGFNLFETLFRRHLQIGSVALSGGELRIVQLATGDTEIYANSTTPIATLSDHDQGSGNLIKDLFEIDKINLSQVHVDWQRKDGRRIDFRNISLEISNTKKSHHMWGLARLTQPNTGSLAFVANFDGDIINEKTINGSLYIHGDNLDMDQWIPIKKIHSLEVTNGFVDAKAWATLSEGKITSVQTNFNARSIEVKNQMNHKLFNINALTANVFWQKIPNGWVVSADNILLGDGIPKEPKKLYFKFNRIANKSVFETYLSQLPVSLLKNIIMISNDQQAKSYIAKYDPVGEINDFYVDYNSSKNYEASFSVNSLSLHTKSDSLGLKNLGATVYFFPNMGMISLNSKNFNFDDRALEKHLVQLKPFKNDIYWYTSQNILKLYWPEINLANNDLALLGDLETDIPLKKPEQALIHLHLNTTNFELNHIKNYLPKTTAADKHLVDFLKYAFKQGAASIQLSLDGPLTGFPYDSSAQNQQGNFTAKVLLHDVDLLYKPGWPMIEKLNGLMNIHNNQLTIQGKTAELYGTSLKNLYGEIPDIADKNQPEIFIKGDIQGRLQQAEQFIKNTPLNKTLGQKLKDLNFDGAMNLRLGLELPLKPHTFEAKTSGTLDLSNSTVTVPHLGLKFTKVNGELAFDHRSLSAKSIKGNFYNEPILIDINTLKPVSGRTRTQFNFWSKITANTLKDRFPNKYIDALSGLTSFHGILDIYDGDKNASNCFSVTSDLVGLSSKLPAPFRLIEQESKPFNAEIKFRGAKPMYLIAQLDKNVHFSGEMRKEGDNFHFYSGDLHFGSGKAQQRKQPGLFVDGHLNYFNWQQWKPWLINNSKNNQTDKSQTELLRLLDVQIDEINFYDYLFVRTQVQLTKQQRQWRIFVNGPAIEGEVYLPTQSDNTITANLKRLYLNARTQEANSESNKAVSPQSLPNLNVTANDFRYGAHVFGNINLLTNKTKKGMNIQRVSSATNRYNFSATGYWDKIGSKELAGLEGNLNAKSISSLLSEFNMSNNLNAKNLKTSFDLYWPASIFKPTLKTLSGNVKLTTDVGVLSGIGNKANNELATGQVLTFLSLQSLQKRILLNFNDLNTEGFHFENMSGDFRIAEGNAWTSDARVEGIVASIAMEGRIGFADKNFNVFTQITPHMTSSLPIIATLAGGPIVGVATYVINKIFSPSLNHMAERYFRITGPWNKPIIKPVNVQETKSKKTDRFEDI